MNNKLWLEKQAAERQHNHTEEVENTTVLISNIRHMLIATIYFCE